MDYLFKPSKKSDHLSWYISWPIIGITVLIVGIMIWWEWDINSQINEPIEIPRIKHIDTKTADTSDLSSKALATEDWQTYQNKEYGFEVKYPSEFSVWKVNGYLRFGIPVTRGGRSDGTFDLYFSGLRIRDNLTIDQFIHNNATYQRNEYQYQDEGNEEINGTRVFWYTLLLGSGNEKHYFFLKDESSGIDANYNAIFSGEINPFSERFNQILSTFRFLD